MNINEYTCILITKVNNMIKDINNNIRLQYILLGGGTNTDPYWSPPTNPPTVGAVNAESPKRTFQKRAQTKFVTEYAYFMQICTIYCMREAVYISYDFRMRAGPLGP